MEVGVIADTHGLVRPEALAALAGVAHIIHAGDIGRPGVLEELAAVAPLTVIRGNVDRWVHGLPDTATLELEGRRLFVIHDVKALDFDPAAAGFDAVIAGHSHQPGIREAGGVLYLNPGSAGPRRFSLPVAVARLSVTAAAMEPRLVELKVPPPRRR